VVDEIASESWRIFIAIEVPDNVRAAIIGVQENCIKRVGGKSMKWTRPDQFHLTIRFLGSLERTALIEMTIKLRQACAGLKPLDLRCADLGIFPERGRPRVVWVGVRDDDGDDGGNGLERTFRAVATATSGFGQSEPEKNFTGHITLARCKEIDRVTATQVKELVRNFSKRDFGSWQAREVQVLRSELSPQGALHSVLERIPLAAC